MSADFVFFNSRLLEGLENKQNQFFDALGHLLANLRIKLNVCIFFL